MRFAELVAEQRWLSPWVYCALMNLRNRLRFKRHSIRPFETDVYAVEDGSDCLYICRRSRHNRSKRGVVAGLDALACQYNLNLLKDLAGGTFVDCGANVGELGVWARARGMRYIAFEPEDMEARCCDLNNYEGAPRTHRLALWHTSGTLEFHTKPDTADSSLIPLGPEAAVKRIRAERLDAVLQPADLGRGPNVLKLEAEGAEPEVLAGAAGLLASFDYITVDCGPERGPERRHTFVETNTALADAGFRPLAAEFKRVTVLYRNVARVPSVG